MVTDDAWCVARLEDKIKELDWRRVREDVERFVRVHELPSLEYWTEYFFLSQCAKLGLRAS